MDSMKKLLVILAVFALLVLLTAGMGGSIPSKLAPGYVEELHSDLDGATCYSPFREEVKCWWK